VKQSPASKDVDTEAEEIVGISHQATSGEDTADNDDLVRAVVKGRGFNKLPITDQKPAYSHSYSHEP
jgi:hypothetical protein